MPCERRKRTSCVRHNATRNKRTHTSKSRQGHMYSTTTRAGCEPTVHTGKEERGYCKNKAAVASNHKRLFYKGQTQDTERKGRQEGGHTGTVGGDRRKNEWRGETPTSSPGRRCHKAFRKYSRKSTFPRPVSSRHDCRDGVLRMKKMMAAAPSLVVLVAG